MHSPPRRSTPPTRTPAQMKTQAAEPELAPAQGGTA